MFWIGLIVGVVISVIVLALVMHAGYRYMNVSMEEVVDVVDVIHSAGHNRKSVIAAFNDKDEVLYACTFEEM